MWEALKSGSVIRYPFLWRRQAGQGETEGRKTRPSAVGLRVPHPKGDLLLIFAITTAQPSDDRWAVEIPEREKRQAGLDGEYRQWLILDEMNIDRIGKSYYLLPEPPLGRFSQGFFAPLVAEIITRVDEITKTPRS